MELKRTVTPNQTNLKELEKLKEVLKVPTASTEGDVKITTTPSNFILLEKYKLINDKVDLSARSIVQDWVDQWKYEPYSSFVEFVSEYEFIISSYSDKERDICDMIKSRILSEYPSIEHFDSSKYERTSEYNGEVFVIPSIAVAENMCVTVLNDDLMIEIDRKRLSRNPIMRYITNELAGLSRNGNGSLNFYCTGGNGESLVIDGLDASVLELINNVIDLTRSSRGEQICVDGDCDSLVLNYVSGKSLVYEVINQILELYYLNDGR